MNATTTKPMKKLFINIFKRENNQMLPKEQELAVIRATVQLKLKPFGPNKAFNMASLSAHLQNHAHIQLTPDQITRYFDSIIDLSFFEVLLQRRQRNAVAAAHQNTNNRHPFTATPSKSTGTTSRPATATDESHHRPHASTKKRKSDEGLPEEDDDTVESGQEDVSVRRHPHQPPPSQKKRSNSHPPSTPTSSSSSTQNSRSNTPRPSLRAARGNVNYKE